MSFARNHLIFITKAISNMDSNKTTTKKTGARYTEAVGRRKTAVARVRISAGAGHSHVNGKKMEDYFPAARDRKKILSPIVELQVPEKLDMTAQVVGGGPQAQVEAVRHGIARALSLLDPALKKKLRVLGFLTRDSRMVERKKYGLKKARRAPQWAKR